MASSSFILGAEVSHFEQQAASYLGSRYAVGLSNGSDALYLALRALDVGSGDEVITSPLTFIATAEAVLRCGATPVFADIEPDSFGLCPASTKRMRSSKTRAVLTVHLYGHPGTALELARYCQSENLPLVEDACQAFGASLGGRKAGTIGRVGIYSFFPTKPLGGFGDGGLLVTEDEGLAARVKAMRSHGMAAEGRFETLAGNFRLDGLQAALLGVKLKQVDRMRTCRQQIAQRYNEALAPLSHVCPPPAPPSAIESAWSLYTLRAPGQRNHLLSHLQASGIEARVYYPLLLPEQPLFVDHSRSDRLDCAKTATSQILSLPMYAGLSHDAQCRVIEAVASFEPHG